MKEKPKRYGGMWTADQLRDLYQSDKTMNDLLDTIEELAATLTETLIVIGYRRGNRVDKIRVRARKLIDEVTQ